MAAFSEGTGLMQGDFLDGVVESALRGMVSQLKAEYRKELGRALKTATSEGAVRASVDPVDDPMVTVPALNTPEDQFSEDQKGKPSQLKTASSTPVVHFSEDQKVRTSKLNPASADSSIGNVDNVEPIWLTPECSDGERSSGKVSTRAWRETLWSKSNGNGRGERTTVTGLWEETMDKLPEDMRTSKVVLTKEDQKEIVRLRAEQIKREEAAKAIVRDFTFIVEPAPDDASRCKKLCFNIVASQRFDFGMGFVIMLNALAIGSETAISRHGGQLPASLHILEYTFLLLYIVELSMRVYVGGLEAFSNNWVRFDAVMVAAGILNFLLTVTFLGGDTAAGLADNINMIKMIRLFRLAKTVRVFPQFRTLWMLVQGVMYAVMPMIWTAILMTVVIYVFAVIAMEIIVVSDEEDGYSIAARNYDTLGGAMMTLMQFMMFDSCAIIYKPIITMKPWLIVYFVVYLLVGPIALLSIVNAIMVESSLRLANEDQEAKKVWEQVRRKEMMPKLRQMFIDLDTSGDGEVDLQEILNAPPYIKETMQHIVGLGELEEIFNLLDYDGSGSVDIEEFVEGILRSKAEKKAELFVILKQGKAILNRLNAWKVMPTGSVRSSAALRVSAQVATDESASRACPASDIS